jgi:proline dehydrogenase
MDRLHILPKLRRVSGVTDQLWLVPLLQFRQRSTAATKNVSIIETKPIHPIPARRDPAFLPPLSVMPTRMLLRSLVITWILSSPGLVSLSLPVMHRVSNSPSRFLNPDRNPLLRRLVRGVFYDHFCAGENEKEVKETIRDMKKMGFDGVILGYAKETLAGRSMGTKATAKTSSIEEVVEQWKRGTLETLAILGPEDFLAVK